MPGRGADTGSQTCAAARRDVGGSWHNSPVAESKKKHYVDNGWPQNEDGGAAEHAVSEFATDLPGALSPFGDVEFPLPADKVPYINPKTVINR